MILKGKYFPYHSRSCLDGLDEVYADYKSIIGDILTDCQYKRNLARVYLTSSSKVVYDRFEMQFCSSSRLVEFSEKNQIDFFRKYEKRLPRHQNEEKYQIYAEKLATQKWVDADQGTIGVPLQVRMLADIFFRKEYFDDETPLKWEDYSVFLTAEHRKSLLPNKLNLITLCELFIHTICYKHKTPLNERLLRSDISKINEECQFYFYIIALENTVTKCRCKLFDCYKNKMDKIPVEVEEKLIEYEFVKKVGDKLRFFHRIVGEYFLADCISAELRTTQNRQFLTFLVEEVFVANGISLVRLFLDSFIDLNSIPNTTLNNIGYIVSEIDCLHGLVKEGLIQITNLIFKCLELSGKDLDLDVRRNGETLLQTAISADQFNIMEYLVKKGAPVESRDNNDVTALCIAANKNNLSAVKFLVEHGAEVTCKDVKGRTPLQEAAASGSLDTLKYLISHGADVNSRDRQGRTSLHEAAKVGQLDAVKFLVEKGADVNCKAKQGTPLFDAVGGVHFNVVKYLVEEGAKLTFRNETLDTVLHKCIRFWEVGRPKVIKEHNEVVQQNEMFKFLIEKGVNINSANKSGNTVLQSLIGNDDRVDLVELLAENGANFQRLNKNLVSALSRAIQCGAFKIVKYITERSASVIKNAKLLLMAVGLGHLNIVTYLAKRGANLKIKNQFGYTTLHAAVKNIDMVKFLVAEGVDVNAKTKDMNFMGTSVLQHALRQKSNFDTIRFLVEHGAQVDASTMGVAAAEGDLQTFKFLEERAEPVNRIAHVGGNFELLRYLIDKGIKVDMSNILHSAIRDGDLDIIRYLVNKGEKISENKHDMFTVLHEAAKYNKVHVIKFLVKHGAQLSNTDYKGETPLNKAIKHSNMESAAVLMEMGADVNEIKKKNPRALCIAINCNRFNEIKFLVECGLEINVNDDPDHSLFSAALRNGYFDIAEYLSKKCVAINGNIPEMVQNLIEAENTALVEDIFSQSRTIRYLLESGMQININDIKNYNLLLSAASGNDLKLIKHLVEKGADINWKDKNGYTALHKTSDFSVTKYLVKEGADVNAKTKEGWTILHEAFQNKNCDICKYLVENGAVIDSEDNRGRSVLYTAALNGSFTKIKYLLEKGVKLKTPQESSTILHDVIQFGDLDLVRYLVQNGAQVDGKNADGRNVLYKAVEGGYLDLVKFLVANGANVNIRDKNCTTLVQYAVDKGDLDIVEYLKKINAKINESSRSSRHEAAS